MPDVSLADSAEINIWNVENDRTQKGPLWGKELPLDDRLLEAVNEEKKNKNSNNRRKTNVRTGSPLLGVWDSGVQNIPMPASLKERTVLGWLPKSIDISQSDGKSFKDLLAWEHIGVIDERNPALIYSLKPEMPSLSFIQKNIIGKDNEDAVLSYFIDYDDQNNWIKLRSTKEHWNDREKRDLTNCKFFTLTSLHDLSEQDGRGIASITGNFRRVVNAVLLGSMLTQWVVAAQGQWGGTYAYEKVTAKTTLWWLTEKYKKRGEAVSIEAIKAANHWKIKWNIIHPGDTLRIPLHQTSGANAHPIKVSDQTSYTIKPGDTLYGIAGNFWTTVAKLKGINHLSSDSISIGQKLALPSREATNYSQPASEHVNANAASKFEISYTVKENDTLYRIGLKLGCTVSQIKEWNHLKSDKISRGQVLHLHSRAQVADKNLTVKSTKTPAPSLRASAKPETIHKVVDWDTVYGIAKKYGSDVELILRANGLPTSLIHAGQKLKVPWKDAQNLPHRKYPKLADILSSSPPKSIAPKESPKASTKPIRIVVQWTSTHIHTVKGVNYVNAILKSVIDPAGNLRGVQTGNIPADVDRLRTIAGYVGILEQPENNVRYAGLCAANTRAVYGGMVKYLRDHGINLPYVWSETIGTGAGAGRYFKDQAAEGNLPPEARVISWVKANPDPANLEKMLLDTGKDIFVISYTHARDGHVNLAVRVNIDGKDCIRIFDPSWKGATETNDIHWYARFHNFEDYIKSFVNGEKVLEGWEFVHGAAPGRYRVSSVLCLSATETQRPVLSQKRQDMLATIQERSRYTSSALESSQELIRNIDNYILSRASHSSITWSMVISSSRRYGIPVEWLLAMMVNDSNLGTKWKWAYTCNPWNVWNDDEWNIRKFDSWDEWVDAVAENLSKRRKAFDEAYSGQEMLLSHIVTNCGPDGKWFLYFIRKWKIEKMPNYRQDNPDHKGAYMTLKSGQDNVVKLSHTISTKISAKSSNDPIIAGQ